MILGYVKLDTKTVGSHTTCRLGKWLATLDQSDSRITGIISKIEKPHSEIHTGAKKAIEAYEADHIETAERLLKDIERNSSVVVSNLMELKKIL